MRGGNVNNKELKKNLLFILFSAVVKGIALQEGSRNLLHYQIKKDPNTSTENKYLISKFAISGFIGSYGHILILNLLDFTFDAFNLLLFYFISHLIVSCISY